MLKGVKKKCGKKSTSTFLQGFCYTFFILFPKSVIRFLPHFFQKVFKGGHFLSFYIFF